MREPRVWNKAGVWLAAVLVGSTLVWSSAVVAGKPEEPAEAGATAEQPLSAQDKDTLLLVASFYILVLAGFLGFEVIGRVSPLHRIYAAFGEMTDEQHFDEDGDPVGPLDPGAVDCLFRYTGRPFDPRAEIENHLTRWYEPPTGKWLNEDWWGFSAGDPNLSRYCGNSPTNLTDPLGLEEGHHLVPRALWSWIGIDPAVTKEVWDAPDARAFPPAGTGHNYSAHGAAEGYTGEVGKLMRDEMAEYRKANKIVGGLTIDQQKDFARQFLDKIKNMPEDSFIGGFNRAVKCGGTAGVKKWAEGIGAASVARARPNATQQLKLGKKAIAALGVLGIAATHASAAKNMMLEPPHVKVAKDEFLGQYGLALREAQGSGKLIPHRQRLLYESLIRYLNALELDTAAWQYAYEVATESRE